MAISLASSTQPKLDPRTMWALLSHCHIGAASPVNPKFDFGRHPLHHPRFQYVVRVFVDPHPCVCRIAAVGMQGEADAIPIHHTKYRCTTSSTSSVYFIIYLENVC